MPRFDTPSAIDLAVNLQVGRIEVVADDRTDTVVTVSPANPARAVDVRGAEDTRVELVGTRLTVTGPKPRFTVIGPTESVDLRAELPTGSRLTAEIAVGDVRTSGRLGATRIKASMGTVDVDAVGDLQLRAGHGSASVATAEGGVEITADHGQIRVGTITGDAVLKASHGSLTIQEAGGDVEAKLSCGDLDITRARVRRGQHRLRRHPPARGVQRLRRGRQRVRPRRRRRPGRGGRLARPNVHTRPRPQRAGGRPRPGGVGADRGRARAHPVRRH